MLKLENCGKYFSRINFCAVRNTSVKNEVGVPINVTVSIIVNFCGRIILVDFVLISD